MNDDKIYDSIKIDDIWFKRQLFKIKMTNDREDAYQVYMVYPILECALNRIKDCSYELIDTHIVRQGNTEKHDRRGYSSLAIAAPDLIIAENFRLHNRCKDEAKYAVSVEIKQIDEKEMLGKSFKKEKELYADDLLVQLIPQLMRGQYVILTNLRVWEFINVKVNQEIKNLPIYKYYEIIEKCGIDRMDNLSDLNSRLSNLIDLLQKDDSKHSEIIKYIDNSKQELEVLNKGQELEVLNERQELAKVKQIFGEVVKLTNNTYKEEIRDFYKKNCKIRTKEIISNDKVYVIDYNVKRYYKKNNYIKSSENIEFVEGTNLDDLISFIKDFIKEKIESI